MEIIKIGMDVPVNASLKVSIIAKDYHVINVKLNFVKAVMLIVVFNVWMGIFWKKKKIYVYPVAQIA